MGEKLAVRILGPLRGTKDKLLFVTQFLFGDRTLASGPWATGSWLETGLSMKGLALALLALWGPEQGGVTADMHLAHACTEGSTHLLCMLMS